MAHASTSPQIYIPYQIYSLTAKTASPTQTHEKYVKINKNG